MYLLTKGIRKIFYIFACEFHTRVKLYFAGTGKLNGSPERFIDKMDNYHTSDTYRIRSMANCQQLFPTKP